MMLKYYIFYKPIIARDIIAFDIMSEHNDVTKLYFLYYLSNVHL